MKYFDLSKIAFNKGCFYVENKEKITDIPNPSVIQFNRELINLGYTLPEEAMYILNDEFIKTYGEYLLKYLHDFLGWYGDWKPLFPGFPQKVWESTESELMLIQMKHYIDGWTPDEESEKYLGEHYFTDKAKDKIFKEDLSKITTLKLVDKEGLIDIYKNVLEMNQSITSDDKEAIQALLKIWEINPSKIPFKENLAYYISIKGQCALKYCSGISDVLRGIFCMLNLSPVLELPKKYIRNGWGQKVDNVIARNSYRIPKIKRKDRKTILALIENYCLDGKVSKDDLKKHRKFWIKLGERIHPGEYKDNYPFANEIFRICREDKIESFGSRLIKAYKEDQDSVLKVLSERPGEFFRRFDSLYRREDFNKTKTLNAMVDLKNNPSIKVILELFEHLQRRTCKDFIRKVKSVNSRDSFTLPKLEELKKEDLLLIKDYFLMTLMDIYSKQESLVGKTVVLEEGIKDIRLPKDMRNASNSLKVVAKGTSFDLPENAEYIRAYTYWYDKHGNLDLDLYCTLIDSDIEKTTNIGWNSRMVSNFAIHSGDVRHRVGHCAEYIDIKIDEAIKEGWRYACIDVHDYEAAGFCNIDNKSGICVIDNLDSGDIFWKPEKNIVQAFKLNTQGNSVLALIIDFELKKVYMVDEDLSGIPVGNYQGPQKKSLIKELIEEPILGVKTLLEANSLARGAKVISEEQFKEIEDPDMENYIFYKKEDFLNDYTLISKLISE